MTAAGDSVSYTSEEIAYIDGIVGILYSRMSGEKLRKSYQILHQHLQDGAVNRIDLQRIESVLAFADPGQCVSCSKEGYRDLTALRLKTQAMLSAAAR